MYSIVFLYSSSIFTASRIKELRSSHKFCRGENEVVHLKWNDCTSEEILRAFVLKLLLTTGINLRGIGGRKRLEMNVEDFYRRKTTSLKSFD